MRQEHQGILLLLANGAGEVVKHVLGRLEPVLSPVLIAVQILVGVGTIVWISYRIIGARIDNKIKQHQLDDMDK